MAASILATVALVLSTNSGASAGVSPPSGAIAGLGDLDPTFGQNGVVFTPGGYEGLDLAAQVNGKVVVGGHDLDAEYPDGQAVVVRYRPDGSLDRQYGQAGVATTPPRALYWCSSVAVAPDGKTVCVGPGGGAPNPTVARFRRGGGVDRTFGDNGFSFIEDGSIFHSVAVQENGRILAGGSACCGGPALSRFTSGGGVDTSFSGDGVASDVEGSAIAVQGDGRIVTTTNDTHGLLRLLADGSSDRTFGTGGASEPLPVPGAIRSLALQPDGKIVVAGGFDRRWVVARYGVDGSLDPTFGDGGVLGTRQGVGGGSDIGVLPDGRIAVSGGGAPYHPDWPNPSWKLLVLTSRGVLDPSFSGDGRARFRATGLFQTLFAPRLAVQADGKVVLAGTASAQEWLGGGQGIALVRYPT